MSQKISNIVKVTITRETQTVKQANFGITLLVDEFDPGDSPPFVGRTKIYGSLEELVADGYASGDYIYDAANIMFQQNPRVDFIKVGAKFITTTPDADWVAALTAIRSADPDWYGLSIKSTTLADQEAVSDWAETQKILNAIRSNDADILDGVAETDIAFYIKSKNYERSFVYYHPTAGVYIECAAMGERFPKNPGSGTWMFKTLKGIVAYSLETDERLAALEKNANIYVNYSGIDMVEQGTVGLGEYLDVMRGIDWLESKIQENIFRELVQTEKVPYTDEGVTLIDGLLKGSLDEGVQNTIIGDDYTTSVPEVSNVPVGTKTNRILPDVKFVATLQGAIHKTEIEGTVSV